MSSRRASLNCSTSVTMEHEKYFRLSKIWWKYTSILIHTYLNAIKKLALSHTGCTERSFVLKRFMFLNKFCLLSATERGSMFLCRNSYISSEILLLFLKTIMSISVQYHNPTEVQKPFLTKKKKNHLKEKKKKKHRNF